MKQVLLTIFFVWLSTSLSYASIEVRSKSISITDGLANNTVRAFLQDSKGFVWLGTLNGLTRYDGNTLISYYPSTDNTLSLADRKVYSMSEDGNGYLWIYFSTGLFSCYDLKNASFVDYTGNGETQRKYSDKIFAANGDTWLWSNMDGVRRVMCNDGEFSSIVYNKAKGTLSGDSVNFIAEETDGIIWIGSSSGLTRVDNGNARIIDGGQNFVYMMEHKEKVCFLTQTNEIYLFNKATQTLSQVARLPISSATITGHFLLDDAWFIFNSSGVYSYNFLSGKLSPRPEFFGGNLLSATIITDNKNNYWIHNHTGQIWYLNSQTKSLKRFRLIPADNMGYIDFERFRVVHDSRNIAWISTYGNGLYAYDITKDEMTHFTAGITGFNQIPSDFLLDVMEDRSGEIWVSADYSGLSCLTVINEGAQRYFPEDKTLLDRSNTIRLVSMVDDEIWIGTRRGGLYKYSSDYELLESKRDNHTSIYAVIRDSHGKIWYGTRGDGLFIDDVVYKHDPNDPYSIANNNIFCIFEDYKGRVWIGTFGGGLALAEKVGNRYRFHSFFNLPFGQRRIRFITEDKNRMIWVATSNGIYIFKPEDFVKDPSQYYHYNHINGELSSNEIKYLFPDSEGNMWIASTGAGFSICTLQEDYQKLSFEHYSAKDGLCNDMVQAITEDKNGHIWLSTEYGISKFIRSEKIFENYFFSAYPQGNIYTETSVCQCYDGNLLFGTDYGFVVFNPDIVKRTSSPSSFSAVFTNLNVNGTNMLPGAPGSPLKHSIAYSDDIRLQHNQNSLIFDFSTFNFAESQDIMYSYKLENYDKNWSAPSTLNFAAYKMLPPGKYELLVKASDGSGLWNDTYSTLNIVITPPFYLTGWAFLIYALTFLLILYITFRVIRQFNSLNNKIAVEKQLTDYKLVFFTNISHEFRTPLTLIQGALDRIQRLNINLPDINYPLQTMEKSTKRLLRLIDQLLEFRKMQNNKLVLALEETDVIAMIYEIFLSFRDIAEAKNMDFRFVPSDTSYKMFVDKGKLDKMAYNILSNAFKYTPQGGKIELIVNVDAGRDVLEISVKDTGVGIPKEKRNELFKRFMQSNFSYDSVGIGLHLTHELAQIHKGNITYNENTESVSGGSIFTIVLPLDSTIYNEKDLLMSNELSQPEQEKQTIYDNDPETIRKVIKPDPLNKQTLLVIEDDIDIRGYLKEELGVYFNVIVAENGKIGFEMAKKENPSLIVCDVLMPEMNGFEVTRKLKSDFNTCHIPIILLTALGLSENHIEGIESGADAYICKPFSFRLLLTRIVKLLEQREKLKEKFSEEPGILRAVIYAADRDKEFVDRFQKILEANLSNANFSIEEFGTLMGMGRTGFYTKVKAITGYSTNEYLRIMRMKKAAELLLTTRKTIAEVSYAVGIDDPYYFSKCFKAQFGRTPSNYQKGL